MTPRKKSKMAGPTKDELRAQLDAALKHVASLTGSQEGEAVRTVPKAVAKSTAKLPTKPSTLTALSSSKKVQSSQRLSFTEAMEEQLLELRYTMHGKRFEGHTATTQRGVAWEYIAVDFNVNCLKDLRAQNYGRVEKEQLQKKHDALKSDYVKAMEAMVEETGNFSDDEEGEIEGRRIWKDKTGKRWSYENLPANWELMVDCFGGKRGLGNNSYGQSEEEPKIIVKHKPITLDGDDSGDDDGDTYLPERQMPHDPDSSDVENLPSVTPAAKKRKVEVDRAISKQRAERDVEGSGKGKKGLVPAITAMGTGLKEMGAGLKEGLEAIGRGMSSNQGGGDADTMRTLIQLAERTAEKKRELQKKQTKWRILSPV
ncbi:hypothetical protein BDR26DRAFT_933856 [Obelidium mucronatum]|nr:hypothetical protein BDR26DRAFT_933856 [Obelidium mucronatum]